MKKERRNIEEIDRFIGETLGISQAESSSEQTVAEFRAKGMENIQEQKQQEAGHAIEQPTPSEPVRSKAHQCQDEKRDARSIQASVPCSNKAI